MKIKKIARKHLPAGLLVKGIRFESSGQNDGDVSIEEKFTAETNKEIREKFIEIIEKQKRGDPRFGVEKLSLELLFGDEVICAVHLINERSIREERISYLPGRGWIDASRRLCKRKKIKNRNNRGYTNICIESSFVNY